MVRRSELAVRLRSRRRAGAALGTLAALALAAAPAARASGNFNCDRSVAFNAERCEQTVVFSIGFTNAKAICEDFSRRLNHECKPDWDTFASCTAFARRFESLLVKTCAAHGMPAAACDSWGQAFAVTPYNRCTQGRFSY